MSLNCDFIKVSTSILFCVILTSKLGGLSADKKADEEYADYEDVVMQKPMSFFTGQPIKFSANLSLGSHCLSSAECESGCCVTYMKPIRENRCTKLAEPGEKCSNAQIKGGFYSEYCPCASGEEDCKHPEYSCPLDVPTTTTTNSNLDESNEILY